MEGEGVDLIKGHPMCACLGNLAIVSIKSESRQERETTEYCEQGKFNINIKI